MNIKELEMELSSAVSSYAHDVQEELTHNLDIDCDRQLLALLDEMNRHNFYVMNNMKHSIIKYLKEQEGK